MSEKDYIYTHCVECKDLFEPGINIHTNAGLRETQISGLCENCFDEITLSVEEDEEYDGPVSYDNGEFYK
jgi:hypothetical protein